MLVWGLSSPPITRYGFLRVPTQIFPRPGEAFLAVFFFFFSRQQRELLVEVSSPYERPLTKKIGLPHSYGKVFLSPENELPLLTRELLFAAVPFLWA